jgi:hypothetical protein
MPINDIAVTDLIRRRFSCRSYSSTPVTVETQARLTEFLRGQASGPFGTSVRLQLIAATGDDQVELKGLGTYGFISGATGYIVGAVDPSTPMALEDFGYVVERVVLFATALELGTVWLGGTFTKSRFAAAMDLQEDEILPAAVALGYPAARPRGLDALIRRSAKADSRLPWETLFYDGSFATPLDRETAGPYAAVLNMVRRAPSASNKQPWRLVRDGARWHLYVRRTRRYEGRNQLVGVADMQRIDTGIAMCHFALTAEELRLPGSWVCEDPGIALPDNRTSYVVSWTE